MKNQLKNVMAITVAIFSLNVSAQTEPVQNNDSKPASNHIENRAKSTSIVGFLALPMGEFGKTDIQNGGFAKNGYGVGFNSKNWIGKGFSYAFLTSYSWVDIDAEAMSKAFTEELGYKTVITGGQHQPFLTTVGLNYDYYFTERIKVGVNGQAGVIYNSFRPFQIKTYAANGSIIYDDIITYESKFAFAYNFGADLNFYLLPKIVSLQISADYCAGNLDTYLISRTFAPIKSVDKMQFLNVGIGLVFYTGI